MTERHIVALSAGLGQPSSTRLLADRLADTVLGVVVGLLVVLAWDRWLSRRQRGSR